MAGRLAVPLLAMSLGDVILLVIFLLLLAYLGYALLRPERF